MSERGDRRAIKAVVSLTQDNILMRKVISLMAHFILDNGIFNATTISNTTQQYYAVVKFFKTEALNELIEKGYDMSVNTPWGYDVSKMIINRDLTNNKYDTNLDDVELEYEDSDEDYDEDSDEEDDLEDEEED